MGQQNAGEREPFGTKTIDEETKVADAHEILLEVRAELAFPSPRSIRWFRHRRPRLRRTCAHVTHNTSKLLVRRYIELSKGDALIQRSVATAINELTDSLAAERKRVPGDVLREAERLDAFCQWDTVLISRAMNPRGCEDTLASLALIAG